MSDLLLTPRYLELLRQKHAAKPWGGGGWSWIPEVTRMVIRCGLQHPKILDYGAGRRTFANTMKWVMPHVEVFEYDPAVPGIDILPNGTFDIVLCSDVLEHVEEQFVDQTLSRLRQYCLYGAVLNICCAASKSLLPDGTNAHVTIKPSHWWQKKLQNHWDLVEQQGQYKNFTVLAFNK